LELKHSQWSKGSQGKTEFYDVPMDEFDLLNIKLENGEEEVVKEGIRGPSVFVVNQGRVVLSALQGDKEEELSTGNVVMIKPGFGWKVKAVEGKADVWGAFVEA
jgi:mannose-6-phosphate isomerase class I